jgi:hypothetical protein
MKLVIIVGPPAAGKASVGAALCERYGFRLFHNHVSLDAVTQVFDWGTPAFGRVLETIRRDVITEAAEAGIDLVFTFVWAFDEPADQEIMERYRDIVTSRGGDVYFLELFTEQDERIRRNVLPGRLSMKRRTPESNTAEWIQGLDRQHRLNTDAEHPFPLHDPYLRVDNTRLHPLAVAEMAAEAFGFTAMERAGGPASG